MSRFSTFGFTLIPDSDSLPSVENVVIRWFPWRTWSSVVLLLLASASGRVGVSDAGVMLELTRALLRGEVHIDSNNRKLPRDTAGRPTSPYGVLTSALWVPAVVAGRATQAVAPRADPTQWEEFYVSFVNTGLVAVLLALLARVWHERGTPPHRVRLGLWLWGLGTLLLPYSKWPFSDTPMALALFLSWELPLRTHATLRHALLSGVAAGLALLARRQADAIVPFIALAVVLATPCRPRLRFALAWFAGLFPLLVLRGAYNMGRFGNAFTETRHDFHNIPTLRPAHVWERITAVVTSEEEGWVYYLAIPLLVAVLAFPAWRRRQPAELAGIVLLAVTGWMLLVWLPVGPSVSLGARYALYLVPLLGVGWAYLPDPLPTVQRFLLAPVAALSLVLMVAGTAIDPVPVSLRAPTLPPGPFPHFRAYLAEARRQWVPGLDPAPPGIVDPVAWNHPAFRHPDFWWLHLATSFRPVPAAPEPR